MSDFAYPVIVGVLAILILGPVVYWSARRSARKAAGDWNTRPANPAPTVVAAPAEVEAPRSGIAGAMFDSREAVYTGETVQMTEEQKKARQRRSHWMALALVAFVILVFLITMTKLGAQVLVRDL